ncbi:MAG: PIN domain-containing protein [Acidobacteria bacterium]|nr:PIN domain-containing protein [Acidobacteriota bacterium]
MIFVDTSFWVALRNGRDARYPEAYTLLTAHGDDSLVTTNHVRGEAWTFLRRRAGHASAVGFLDAIDRSPRIRVVTVPEETERSALRWLRRHDEREYSFVDATSFAVMKSLRIRHALAFDGDFSAAGFAELRTPG